MHIIKDTDSGEIIYVDYTYTQSVSSGEDLYPQFDSNRMAVGWTEQSYLPAHFDIDKNGNIVEIDNDELLASGLLEIEPSQKLINGKIADKSQAELIEDGLIKLDDIKQGMLELYNAISFAKRNELIPDYKLNNAALGVYDDRRMADYKVTIQAFRDEAKRITGLINGATSVADLEAIEERFPTSIVSAD